MNKSLSIVSLLSLWLAIVLLPAAVRAQEPAAGATGIVSAPLANVHEEPISKSALVTQVLMGDEVVVLEKIDNRYRITIPSQGGREGWVQREAVIIPKDKGRTYLNTDRQWIVVRKPKTEALILHKTGDHKVPLYGGTRLPLVEKKAPGHDYKVQFPDKSEALITADDAMVAIPFDSIVNDTRPEDIVSTARRFLGVRFLAGGLTAQGMDTNGLIYITYRIHGLQSGTDPAFLKSTAEQVSKKELEPGDVLSFFGEGRGLYLGNGQFLHAPRKGAVQAAGMQNHKAANSLQYGLRIIGAGANVHKAVAAMTADEVLVTQARAEKLPVGKRIAYWAGRFIGTPYDTDPLGHYVRKNRIVVDEKADCMYHTFRAVELARSTTPSGAIERALDLRFLTQGRLTDGLVVNYDERFQYGEDMVFSGKWGRNITADLGTTKQIPGSRGRDIVIMLPKATLQAAAFQKKLQDGDIVFWVKDPKKRVVEEIVAHLSIIHVKAGKTYLIHAGGDKDRKDRPGGGVVKEVPFNEYVKNMKFVGAFVTRFEE